MNTYSRGLGHHEKMRMKKTHYLQDHDRALISISVPYPIWIISFQIRHECDTNHTGMCPSWSFRDLKQGTTEWGCEAKRGAQGTTELGSQAERGAQGSSTVQCLPLWQNPMQIQNPRLSRHPLHIHSCPHSSSSSKKMQRL